MTNDITKILFDNDKVQEILKNISTLDLPEAPGVELTPEQKKFAQETNVTNPTLSFFIESLKGKFTGRNTQVDQTSVVGTSQSLEEKAIEIVGTCNGVVSGGSNVPGGEVKRPLVGQSVKERSDDGRSL